MHDASDDDHLIVLVVNYIPTEGHLWHVRKICLKGAMFDWKGFDPVRFTFYRFGKRMTKASFCQTLRFKVCGGMNT